MSAQPAFENQEPRAERRAFQRVKVSLFGRFMLKNKQEYPCQIINMSPGNAGVLAVCTGQIGEPVVAYVDHIGRIEGQITRVFDGGFGMTISATARKRDKLSAKLTWLSNKQDLGLPEDRRHDRVIPRDPMSELKLDDGRAYRCKIIDMSLSGSAIEIEVKPAMGSMVTLGGMRGRVVRHFEEGIAIEFAAVQDGDSLSDFLKS
ncbi:MAG: PilZ domain-containing protein [Pseudomonadota bacterium]